MIYCHRLKTINFINKHQPTNIILTNTNNQIQERTMQKTTAFKPQKYTLNSSPDSKRTNIVKPTQSPVKEIQKFISIKHKKKYQIHSQSMARLVPTNQRGNAGIDGFSKGKEEQYKRRIRELEEQVAKYQDYVSQCGKLAEKNRMLEEQMQLILQQLQNRYDEEFNASADPSAYPLKPSLHTLTESIDQNTSAQQSPSPRRHSPKFSPHINSYSRDTQIQQLHRCIQNLEQTLNQVVQQSQQFQIELRKGVKKDMNQMQQKLMNYIFGLEDKVSEATFRNNSVMRRMETGREIQWGRSDRSGDGVRMTETGRSEQSGKKDSIISMMNLQISSSSKQLQQKTSKKSFHVQSQAERIKTCDKCSQYLKQIENLNIQCRQLEQQLKKNTKIDKKQKMQNEQKSEPSQTKEVKKLRKQSEETDKLEFILEAVQVQQTQQKRNKKMQQKLNILQSNINILVQSSNQDSLLGSKQKSESDNKQKQKQKDQDQESQLIESQQRLSKIKQQLVNIMQDLQQIVHQCQYDPVQNVTNKNGIVAQLHKKVREQTGYIGQLEEEVSRLRMEVEQGRASRERLEKFMKLQVRQQQQIQSPYFRPIKQPISCIDHQIPKNKLNHVITQMKKLKVELQEKPQNQLKLRNNKQQQLTF